MNSFAKFPCSQFKCTINFPTNFSMHFEFYCVNQICNFIFFSWRFLSFLHKWNKESYCLETLLFSNPFSWWCVGMSRKCVCFEEMKMKMKRALNHPSPSEIIVIFHLCFQPSFLQLLPAKYSISFLHFIMLSCILNSRCYTSYYTQIVLSYTHIYNLNAK